MSPSAPKMPSATGASSASASAASTPPATLSWSARTKSRRSFPHSSLTTYRKPNFVSGSSTVRSRSTWKKPTAASAVT